eukprot:TRINITY_DN8521_c2_g1_i1.p1 TRINITY_DN8521_c2_g1~~TRINITY_DN8521_c2_g1_i1.p1  ORF type:complete len:342 (+),score=44.10 TRINITY_DN8521_c2_g1_i1:49-1074(+)
MHRTLRAAGRRWLSSAATEMNMCTAINLTMKDAMRRNDKMVIFGEDVGFGGVFRCSVGLRDEFGRDRVFNTPVNEQGLIAFAVGLCVAGHDVIAEIQFADYIFPAFDQIVNEVAKYRYRAASNWDVGGLVIRAPCSAVGHGSMYHSQSVESYFAHCPGLKIVIPRGPYQAKGLLNASVADRNPILFFEPKTLYRNAEGSVPDEHYTIPIGQADVVRVGSDITMVGWGTQVDRMLGAASILQEEHGVSVEVIDLQTIVPWDVVTVTESVRKTGRCIVTHEAPVTNGFGAELTSTIQERCFLSLEAPIQRVCGYDTHFPLAWEEFYLPSVPRLVESAVKTMNY